VRQVYSSADGGGERPGEFPFTRGRLANPHTKAAWIQRELSGEGDGRRSNEQIRYLLDHGQTGIDVIGDAPTQSLLDPDHPLARSAVGTQGVSLCRKQDFLDLFQGVRSIASRFRAPFRRFLRCRGWFWRREEAGLPLNQLRGSVLHAPLYTEDCSYAWHLPVKFEFASRSIRSRIVPRKCRNSMPISRTPIFSVNQGSALWRKWPLASSSCVTSCATCSRAAFRRFIRAANRHAGELRHGFLRGDCQDPRHAPPVRRDDARGIRCGKYPLDVAGDHKPYVRSFPDGAAACQQHRARAIQALSLVLAGVQALEISAFDEAYRTPSKDAHIVGLRTQQIIDLESGVAKVLDPLGGSYFVESLTDELGSRIRARIDEIEAMGDPEALADAGYFRNLFHQAMEDGQRSWKPAICRFWASMCTRWPPRTIHCCET